ncbi:LytR/AlgR family response regulator transcription factor [Mesoterricola silvestris]|uniref:Response regulatory domain-containing protein n=1 Tax=Mesoterricola silvestris TaxID=2927979 RepID=A0AA48K7Z0_9BACT|nr:response regulator [Mesoterricola silvestris]BDU72409.1 hypothetical protein METEAL_15830 [Mesoterricola silvestris]
MRCLVADDEPFSRAKMSKYLRELGCEVIYECGDGESVVDWITANPTAVDALFLDIQMPRASGLDVLDTIQDRQIPVVFVTGHREYAISAFDLAASDFLEKPITLEKVRRAVERVKGDAMLYRYHGEVHCVTVKTSRTTQALVPITAVESFSVSDRMVTARIIGDPQDHEVVGHRTLKSVEDAFPREQFKADGRSKIIRML